MSKQIDNDLISPIRTRGPIRVRGAEVSETASSAPVRTRGPIRTRGPATRTRGGPGVHAPTLEVERSLKLEDLVAQLREQVGYLPLTLFLHGWASQSAQEFLTMLSPMLRREDALWLIPMNEGPTSAPLGMKDAVVLNLKQDTDLRTYRNLNGDLLFFPALEASEGTQVAEWRKRARAVIIDGRGPQGNALLQAGCEARLMTYRWSGEMALGEYVLL